MNDLILLSRLLDYPEEAGLLANLNECKQFLDASSLSVKSKSDLTKFLEWMRTSDPLTVQETYIEKVDRSRHGSLYLFEHIHGESRERGGAMIDLQEFYRQRGLTLQEGHLPDYLPAILEFSASCDNEPSKLFLSEITHVVEAIYQYHESKQSPWACVLSAVLEFCNIDVSNIQLVFNQPEENIDAIWQEPEIEFMSSKEGCK